MVFLPADCLSIILCHLHLREFACALQLDRHWLTTASLKRNQRDCDVDAMIQSWQLGRPDLSGAVLPLPAPWVMLTPAMLAGGALQSCAGRHLRAVAVLRPSRDAIVRGADAWRALVEEEKRAGEALSAGGSRLQCLAVTDLSSLSSQAHAILAALAPTLRFLSCRSAFGPALEVLAPTLRALVVPSMDAGLLRRMVALEFLLLETASKPTVVAARFLSVQHSLTSLTLANSGAEFQDRLTAAVGDPPLDPARLKSFVVDDAEGWNSTRARYDFPVIEGMTHYRSRRTISTWTWGTAEDKAASLGRLEHLQVMTQPDRAWGQDIQMEMASNPLRSTPSLRVLELRAEGVITEQMRGIFETMPLLEEFAIIGRQWEMHLDRVVELKHCPRLRRLQVSPVPATLWEDERFFHALSLLPALYTLEAVAEGNTQLSVPTALLRSASESRTWRRVKLRRFEEEEALLGATHRQIRSENKWRLENRAHLTQDLPYDDPQLQLLRVWYSGAPYRIARDSDQTPIWLREGPSIAELPDERSSHELSEGELQLQTQPANPSQPAAIGLGVQPSAHRAAVASSANAERKPSCVIA